MAAAMARAITVMVMHGTALGNTLGESQLRLFFPPWGESAHPYTLGPDGMSMKTTMDVGTLAFGPDPATSFQAELAEVKIARAASEAEDERELTDGIRSDFKMVFNFTPLQKKRVRHLLTVVEQRIEYKLCPTCQNLSEAQHDLTQRMRFLDSGWKPVKQVPACVEVSVPLVVVNTTPRSPRGFVAVPLPQPAEVFMGGVDLDQLDNPRALVFHQGDAYIVDTNNDRVLKKGTSNESALATPPSFSRMLRNCSRAIGGYRGCSNATCLVVALGGKGCRVSMPTSFSLELGRQGSLPQPPEATCNKTWQVNITEVPFVPDIENMSKRARLFAAFIGAFAVALVCAHAWGSWWSHAAMAVVSVLVLLGGMLSGRLWAPALPWGPLWTRLLSIICGVALPWAVVPVHIFLSFHPTTQWSADVVDLSCSSGVRWEYHMFTLCCAGMSISLWSTFTAEKKDKVEPGYDPLVHEQGQQRSESGVHGEEQAENTPRGQWPGCLAALEQTEEFLVPDIVRKLLSCDSLWRYIHLPKPKVVVRLTLLFKWLYASIFDMYGDINAYLITSACGFRWALYGGVILILSVVLQNLGGSAMAFLELRSHSGGPGRFWKVVACLFTSPPMELLGLTKTGLYLAVVRNLFEDVPQLVYQVVFTCEVRADRFVVFNMCLTSLLLLLTLKDTFTRVKKSMA